MITEMLLVGGYIGVGAVLSRFYVNENIPQLMNLSEKNRASRVQEMIMGCVLVWPIIIVFDYLPNFLTNRIMNGVDAKIAALKEMELENKEAKKYIEQLERELKLPRSR